MSVRRSTSRPRAARRSPRRPGRLRRLRTLASSVWPSRARRRRWWRSLRRAPTYVQIAAGLAALLTLWMAANTIFQVVRKPTELFFPVSGVLHKTPAATWGAYASIFRRHSTDMIPAELLAALAQVEGSGNPVARTYWRFSWRADPFELYRPASSAVGMYQITDGTFERAKRYCIHDHEVVEEGPWHDWHSCWLNELYFRVIPSDAVEMTSAFLDRNVSNTLERHKIRNATRAQQHRLAAVIHLCGTGAADRYAKNGLAFAPGARCGSHDPLGYLARVDAMKQEFAKLAEDDR